VLSLTGKTEPATGLEGKFSIYHCVAVGLAFGAAGEKQFQDPVVRDPAIIALRRKVNVLTDASVDPAQCDLTVKLQDGRSFSRHIQDVIGSLKKPMSDQALETKFFGLADGILPNAQARRLLDQCWTIDKAPDAGVVARIAAT
jgi:2-methylcitrate dehydratase PrpD